MSDKVELSGGIALLLGVAATAGIVFALQAASGILVPILLAVFLALICTGPMLWLVRRGVPESNLRKLSGPRLPSGSGSSPRGTGRRARS